MNTRLSLFAVLILFSCSSNNRQFDSQENIIPANILDYTGNPTSPEYRKSLAFSDQGAWFAYGFPTNALNYGGFSGPFLMTQENGVWCSEVLSQLQLTDINSKEPIPWTSYKTSQKSYTSHLEQVFENESLKISQSLFYSSAHTALITTKITNISGQTIKLQPEWAGASFLESLQFDKNKNTIIVNSEKSTAKGIIQVLKSNISSIQVSDQSYKIKLDTYELKPGEVKILLLTQSFIFPEYDMDKELLAINGLAENYQSQFHSRVLEKENQLNKFYNMPGSNWSDSTNKELLVKTILTLQNNWRIPAGELKHAGLFPSYHYIWFHGFWAWDSWKHSVALAQFNTDLAKEQIKAMYDFYSDDGFIADCVYRDTTIENHNYRNTKPPLSAWAVWEVYQQDNDLDFLNELYPKLKIQHNWWYKNRDHDKDGICEYGSTDGTLIAAKWESGMDNAVRFDDSKILKNSESAWSLDQESVDLNAYLYAEKIYLNNIAKVLQNEIDASEFESDAEKLKLKIQKQFFDTEAGWFFDTSIDGKRFVKVMGCEGWIPLWAEVATKEQAEAIKNNMIDPKLFNTKVPFQTLSANHPKFKPEGGYWRGPNWLDQAYFGVKGLQNYGYIQEANDATYKLIHNAEGVLQKGKSIRENYNPITGDGLESESFSWSAAHYLLLLINK